MSGNRRLQTTIQIIAAIAFSGMTGCARIISDLAKDATPSGQLGTTLQVPHREAQVYESPIPRWNSAYQGATSNQTPAEKKHLAQAYHMLDGADAIIAAMSGLLDPTPDEPTPLAITFCMSGGVPHRREKDWFANMFSLQPGGLGSSLFDGRLTDKCYRSYRDSH